MSRAKSGHIAATFIVRMWTEHAEGEAPQWRGQVEHVQSDEQAYFRNLDRMVELIVGYREDGQEERQLESNEQVSANDIEGKGDD